MDAGRLALDMVAISAALVVLSVGVGAISQTVHAVLRAWVKPSAPAPAVPAAPELETCGVIDAMTTMPCVLGRNHGDYEHASTWVDDVDDNRRETRHRWDANSVEGRTEARWKAAYLPKFTPSGERRS